MQAANDNQKFSGKNLSLSDFEEIIDPKNNQKYSILGKGNFAYTEKMRYKKGMNDDIYAIKKLDITHIEESKQKKMELKRETQLHSKLSHENIVKFYSYFTDEENINKYKEIYKNKENIQKEKENKKIACLVLEYLPNGTLKDFINNFLEKNKNGNIPQPFVIKVFRELLEGLIYLKSKKILHRDIKPENILFDKNYRAKISDFGISALCNSKEEEKDEDNDENKENEEEENNINETDKDLFMNNSLTGDKNYVSYEIIQCKKYDYQTDVYSLGVTIFYMMTGNLPCYTNIQKNSKGKQYIIRKRNFNDISNYYCYELRNLIENMIDRNPKKRPTIEQVYEEVMKIEFPLKNLGDTLADFEGKNEKMMYKKNYIYYYIKKYANNTINIPMFQKLLYKQNKILKKLSHKNIIKYYGLLEDQLLCNNPIGIKDYFLIYEYIPNGSLADMIEKNKNKLFPEYFVIKIFKQILSGLKYLHNENIAHGNLSPNNILFDSKYNIKITGFDYFGLYEDKHYTKSIVRDDILFINNHYKYFGQYTSPEMIKGNEFNDKADIFSLGLIILCMLSYPLQFQKFDIVKGNAKRDIYLNNINKIYSQKLSNLISKMVNEKPENRPSSYDVYEELINIEKELIKTNPQNNINQDQYIIPNINNKNKLNSFPINDNNFKNYIDFMNTDSTMEYNNILGNFKIYYPTNNNNKNDNPIMNNNFNMPMNNFNNMPMNDFSNMAINNFDNMPMNNFTNIPKNDFNNMPTINSNNIPMNNFNNMPMTNFNNIPKNKFNNMPMFNSNNIPMNNFNNMPMNNFNNIPINKFNNIPMNNFNNMPMNSFSNIANNFYNNKNDNNNNYYSKNNINCINNRMPNYNFGDFNNNMNFNNQSNNLNVNMNNFNGINNVSMNNLNNMNNMANNFNNNNNKFNDIVILNNINKNLLNQINGQQNFDSLSIYVERKNNLENFDVGYLSNLSREQIKQSQKKEEGKNDPYYLDYLSSDDVIVYPSFDQLRHHK